MLVTFIKAAIAKKGKAEKYSKLILHYVHFLFLKYFCWFKKKSNLQKVTGGFNFLYIKKIWEKNVSNFMKTE